MKNYEELVIKLLNENLINKEIAKRIHLYLSGISKIKRKLTGEDTKKEKQTWLSIPPLTFKLFKDGKSLIDVKIILDLPKDELIQNYLDYLTYKYRKSYSNTLRIQ